MDKLGNVMGIIGAVVALTISLYFVDPIAQANDGFYRLNTEHCAVAGTTTRNIQAPEGTVVPVTKGTSGACAADTTETSGTTENGTSVTIASKAISDGKWTEVPSFLGSFQSIVLLIISLIPLMIAVGFIGTAFRVVKTSAMGGADGSGMINDSVIKDIAIFLSVVVAVFVAEPFMAGVGEAANSITRGNLDSADQFSTISKLAYSILPLGYATGIIALVNRPTWSAASRATSYLGHRMGNGG